MKAISRFIRSKYFWYSFAALTVFAYFFGLTVPLLGPDEPRYAQVAREMYARNDWITPTLGGYNWFEKPSLLYWLQILAYHIFGVGEFAARAGSAVFGLGTIACLWLLGKTAAKGNTKLSNNRVPHNNVNLDESVSSQNVSSLSLGENVGNYLGLVAASTLGIMVFSRGASFDIILTFPIAAAMTGFFVFDRCEAGEKWRFFGLAAFYFFIGVSVLAKGLVGFVFPFAIVTFYHVLLWRMPSRVLLTSILWGVPFAIIAAATWYLPMYLRHGWEFIDEFFIQHHFQRYTSNKYRHPQPFYFFFWVLPLMTIPWLPFFFAGVWSKIREIFSPKNTATQRKIGGNGEDALLVFAFAWMLVPLVFFSFSGSKLPGYIMPSVPPAIVIAGVSAFRFTRRSRGREAAVKFLGILTLVVIIFIIQFALPRFAETDSVKGLIMAADKRGYGNSRIAGFMTISHNAEFYGAGRLWRSPDGSQARLNNVSEVLAVLSESDSKPLLLITRQEHTRHLEKASGLATEILGQSGDHTIVVVRKL